MQYNKSPKLIIKDLSKTFNQPNRIPLQVFINISINLYENELVSIIGPSGCGKSTLLDCIAGLLRPDKGEILLDNISIRDIRGYVAYMMQDSVLFPWRSVLDNVIIPLQLQGMDTKSAQKEVLPLLHEFGLGDFALSYPYVLSGGMRQRACLLRAYLCQKDVMLLDEPFAKLDVISRLKMQRWFLNIWKKKSTILFVTHDIDEALFLSDRIFVLSPRPGKIIEEIRVAFKRPRSTDIITHIDFIRLKKKLLHLLRI